MEHREQHMYKRKRNSVCVQS